MAYQMGYKAQRRTTAVDVALFYSDYNNLMTTEPGAPFPVGMAATGAGAQGPAFEFPVSGAGASGEPAAGPPGFGQPAQPILLMLPLRMQNLARGESYGTEVTGTWEPGPNLKLNASYSWLTLALHRLPGSTDSSVAVAEGESPRHQGRLSSYSNITRKLSADTTIFLVGRLPARRS